MTLNPQLQQVLDAARWAPSGDNTQPWRFKVVNDHCVEVHCFDTRTHCVYDLDGHPSQIAMGALLETMIIAASTQGWQTSFRRRPDSSEEEPIFEVQFDPRASISPDPLAQAIESRSVQRRPLSKRPLSADEAQALEAAVGGEFEVHWLSSAAERRKTAALMFKSAKIRLTIPEAYEVHKDIIDWGQQFSEAKVPDQALGTDAATTWLMQHIMKSWRRVQFFNRFMAGTWMPRIQLDLIPALCCAAHFTISAKKGAPTAIDDYVAIGRSMQRFWLTATKLGLQLQPEVTPLVFSRYARQRREFSRSAHATGLANQIRRELQSLLGPDAAAKVGFMGRIGAGPAASSRSIRRPLNTLIITND